MTEDDLLAFIATSIGSIWALELLLVLRRDPERGWAPPSLVHELRSSPNIVEDALGKLLKAGLMEEDGAGMYRYRAASPQLDRLASEVEQAYATRPTTVINAMVRTRDA